jgi:NADH:ubiquinone oxidoreductase subunit C
MTSLATIAEKLDVAEPWVEKGPVAWLNIDASRVRRLASVMNDCHARFITITASQLPKDEGIRLDYLWDLDGRLVGFPVQLKGNSIESIYDLCEAVDWIEREVHEGFAVDFTGRDYEPLLLRPGDKLGVNLREVPQ